ncbi:hypothetical protein K490DRAFT_22404, partial [Saccharata proteae CBS 121410]
ASSEAKAAGAAAADAAKKAPKEGNPVFKMMGMPNLKWKLPSRNWMIFFSITGAWTAALVYDRREQKRVQKKWCDLVSHISKETLPPTALPRKMTIFLSAPPEDGLLAAREHYHEYVKPILVAAAMDWDAVEGRREGDVRAALAERIRRLRKSRGEASQEPLEADENTVVEETRAKSGIRDYEGVKGDIVIGRNTWKEYVRGLHEGWLGPLDPPQPPPEEKKEPEEKALEQLAQVEQPGAASTEQVNDAPAEEKPAEEKPAEEEQKPAKRKQPPPFIAPSEYPSASLSPNCPAELPPSATVTFPHLLGFLKTPIRMYRFLTRRHLADDIGRQVAAAVLAAHQPYQGPDQTFASDSPVAADEATSGAVPMTGSSSSNWEQEALLKPAEQEWHKIVRKRAAEAHDAGKESLWVDDMVLDPRIASRMSKFVLDPAEEARAQRIAAGQEK